MEALYLGIGVVLGAALVWFFAVRGKADHSEEVLTLREENTKLETQIEERERSHEEKLQAYEDAEQALKDSFGAASMESLKKAQEQFAKIAEQVLEKHKEVASGDLSKRQQAIDEMLKPMREKLKDLDEYNRDIEKSRATAYGELMEQVKSLSEQQAMLGKETNRLVTALQSPGTAGSWGEMVLERVIEMAGLQKHQTFITQKTFSNEEGDTQRPDMLIKLPGGRCLIIDSKAPMKAYTEGVEAKSEDERVTLFTAHAKSMLEHSKELKRRDYSQHEQTPDFTVMFVPSESAFRVAVDVRPTLIEEAMENNVVLATPTTLLALLRAVAYGWRQQQLAELANEVQKDGALLYNAICVLTEHYDRLGDQLKKATESYNKFGASLEGRVLPAARRFKEHGVQTNKEIGVVEPIEFEPRSLQGEELTSGTLPLLEKPTVE